MAMVMAAAKNTQIPVMKSISASTCGAKLDAVEVTGDVAVRGEKQNAAGMGEKIIFRVKGETEIRGFGRGLDGFLRASEEVPSGIGFRAAEMSPRLLFLLGGHLRSFARI